ncbi:DNA polymerase III subunit gamma/tau [Lactobacillus delbrueckii subsp. lactis]|jgi:DNA polymerase III subunit gamma/tau|uniref:DNA-directed DNA polymerase n=2 Tax=Lactobacillus delbrueckii TaxID=1584 RepID=A0A4Q7DV67_9LACO|nr:DNA polymerase III subunit gamma/tau [Lactobacillus delbrueckii]APG68860.1 DNA polymerase III subunit gamma/tau [Lactobacillus delbrueckii subsp. lactis]ASW64324.1 DNA polymerase III subunit gamma/tau [Lactobacillus delbrueckii subsp. lactis]EPB98379.1 DNA polymerase III, subunits gamma and tau [Lactobacillus delbrueckii subsp. lactis CRL581]MCD5441531.1 DNA polymerase III subunit gamma/tau [Lactobacillus delbrueckii subsp. lactis]MCD5444629.1 DNA polymerase III subunit gamma/tau [Lactobaci
MAYQALYRKWRPRTFDDVVGQEAITDTLKNSLIRGKVSHAFLFAGPRGTGKTSCAKIFAKALNCLNLQEGEPCNECSNCLDADQGAMPDIVEMDAASNNSVDEIRDLLDKVHYAPTEGKYKVYIIDEVHMLSISAFNALLKTLEEPPASVVFILATTELQKVPATIISRTQRYNFKRFSNEAMVQRMEYILGQEGVEYEDKALKVIAQVADGGMRDALSILDQLLSFEKSSVRYEDALEVTGFAAQEQVEKLLLALLNGDSQTALDLAKSAIQDGASAQNILNEIISLTVQAMLFTKTGQGEFLTDDFAQEIAQQSPDRFSQIIDQANDALGSLRFTNQQQIPLEVFLVQASQKRQNSQAGPQVASAASNPAIERQIKALKEQVHQLTQQVQQLSQRPSQAFSPRHVFQLNQQLYTQKGGATEVAQQAAEKQQQAESLQAEITSSQEEIYAVLSQATKSGLAEARNLWDRDLPSMLEEPAKTVLGFLQPIAASDRAVLLSSQSRAWQLATNPQEFLATLKADLDQLTKESWTIAIVDEKAWPKIRQEFIKEHASQLRAKAQPAGAPPAEEAAPEPPLPDQAPPEEAADDAIVTKAEELFGPLAQVKD